MEMTQLAKDKLKTLSVTHCAKCDSRRSYTNPMARCYECKKKFCYDHILGAQHRKGMDENEQSRDICENCQKVHKYQSVG